MAGEAVAQPPPGDDAVAAANPGMFHLILRSVAVNHNHNHNNSNHHNTISHHKQTALKSPFMYT